MMWLVICVHLNTKYLCLVSVGPKSETKHTLNHFLLIMKFNLCYHYKVNYQSYDF